jgi:hypothetical protein
MARSASRGTRCAFGTTRSGGGLALRLSVSNRFGPLSPDLPPTQIPLGFSDLSILDANADRHDREFAPSSTMPK